MPFTYRDLSILREMSEQQLVDTLKFLSGGILRELYRRGFEVELSVRANLLSVDPTVEALEVQLRHPTAR